MLLHNAKSLRNKMSETVEHNKLKFWELLGMAMYSLSKLNKDRILIDFGKGTLFFSIHLKHTNEFMTKMEQINKEWLNPNYVMLKLNEGGFKVSYDSDTKQMIVIWANETDNN